MREGWREAREAVAAGAAFARTAWRTATIPLAVAAVGQTALFCAGRAELPPSTVLALGWTGAALLALALAPKLGALHRAAAGGAAAEGLGAGGLQWGRIEWRLLATTVALAACALILLVPLGASTLLGLAALRPLGAVRVGESGQVAAGLLWLAPLLVAAGGAIILAVGRLAVTLPADVVERDPRFARGWLLTRGHGLAAGLTLFATCVAPTALLLGATAGLDALESAGGAPFWPLADALLAGAVLAALTQFVAAPLNAGALAHLFRKGVAGEPIPAPAPVMVRCPRLTFVRLPEPALAAANDESEDDPRASAPSPPPAEPHAL